MFTLRLTYESHYAEALYRLEQDLVSNLIEKGYVLIHLESSPGLLQMTWHSLDEEEADAEESD